MYLKPLRTDIEGEVAMEEHVLSEVTSYPTSLDWREKGFVTQVNYYNNHTHCIGGRTTGT